MTGSSVVPPFTGYTPNAVRDRILGALALSGYDVQQGSFPWDLETPVALEIGGLYQGRLNFMIMQMFPDTATGTFLDAWAATKGLERVQPQQATGQVQFTGRSGTTIPINLTVSTVTSRYDVTPAQQFQLTQTGIIPGSTTGSILLSAQAMAPGSAGNVAAGRIVFLNSPVPGVTAVTNPLPFSNGRDTESDDQLRSKLLQILAAGPPNSGNQAHLLLWLTEATNDYRQAKVIPRWNGRGTAKIVFTNAAGGIPSAGLITQVKNYIDPPPDGYGLGQAPIDQAVTVVGPTPITINVVANVQVWPQYSSDLQGTQFRITQNLNNFVANLNMGDEAVYTRIGAVIQDTGGVYKYTGLTVNGGTADITIADDQKAVIGTLTLTMSVAVLP